MAKHKNEDAFYARMRELAKTNEPSLNESHALGTLVDYERTVDGIAYGIIKENHKFYIKKGGLKENPDVADFAYIGGLQNLTEHQYPTLSAAEKNRNFLLSTINESLSHKVNKTGSRKQMLTEDTAEKEIDAATNKIDDLEAATDAAAVADAEPVDSPEADAEEMAAGMEAMPSDGDEEVDVDVAPKDGGDVDVNIDEPAPEGEEGSEEMPMDEPEGEEGSEEEKEALSDIQEKVGEAADEIKKTKMNEQEIAWLLGTFLRAFIPKGDDDAQNKMRLVDDSKREEYANMIKDVTSDDEKDSIADSIPPEEQDGGEMEEGEECSECGTFKEYAESRGYDMESLMECGEEEMTNLVSGYANANGEGQNDGDHKVVALFVTPEIIEKLKSEYGHEDFANQIEPVEMGDEEREMEINELFGGLKNLGKAAGQGIKKGAQQVGQAVADKAQQVGQDVQQAATNVKQTYHAGELPKEIKNLEKQAADLGSQVDSLNKRMEKAGGQPLNVGSILTTIKNQIAGAKGLDLSKYGSVQEEGADVPVDSTEVMPPMEEGAVDEDVDIKVSEKEGKKLSTEKAPEVEMKEDVNMTTGFDPMGGGVVGVNEAEIKLRKYIRNRLEEKTGRRKPALTENKKSETIQKLDKVIDKQLALFENEAVNEIWGLSAKEKISNLNPQDAAGVEKMFYDIFKNIMTNPQMGAIARAVKTTPVDTKYQILQQYAENNGGTLRLTDRDTVEYAGKDVKDAATSSQFSGGGTQGRTKFGGVTG